MGSTRAKRRRRLQQTLRVPVWYYILLGVIAAGGIVAIVLSNIDVPPRPMDARDLVGRSDHPLGSMNAPVTVIDWSSPTCGYCVQHVRETMPLLKEDYIDTGKVRYVHRPVFALESDALRLAAESLYCAAEEGKFWAMHDWQYENNGALVSLADDVTATLDLLVQQVAPALGLNTVNLANCLETERYRTVVEGFVQDGQARGITSTPTFLVNTELEVGATYEVLRDLIEKELAK